MRAHVETKLKQFFEKYPHKKYRKGEVLLRQFEEPEGVFFITHGNVRMYTVSQEGEEYELNIYKAPSFFPIGWMMNNTENRYYYEAISDVELYIAPKHEALDFITTQNDVLLDLASRIYKGLDGFFMRMEALLAGVAYYKTIAEIIISIRRFGEQSNSRHSFHVKLTHHQIASRTGLSRETVTREIRKLQKKGMVAYEGDQLTVLDIRKLEEELANF